MPGSALFCICNSGCWLLVNILEKTFNYFSQTQTSFSNFSPRGRSLRIYENCQERFGGLRWQYLNRANTRSAPSWLLYFEWRIKNRVGGPRLPLRSWHRRTRGFTRIVFIYAAKYSVFDISPTDSQPIIENIFTVRGILLYIIFCLYWDGHKVERKKNTW